MTPTLRSILAGATAVLALATAGCNKDTADDDVATRTPPGTAAPAPAPAPAATGLRVTDVSLGRAMVGDTAVAEDIDDFRTTDTIHAVVKHEGAGADARITARWTFQDGQVVDERTETVAATGTAAAYTHFQVSKPGGWPAGNYKLTILVNGQEVESEDFEIGD
jgi:hypothetical protein